MLVSSCSSEDELVTIYPDQGPSDWLIPKEEVLDSGVGMDGIPSIDSPNFDIAELVNDGFDDQLVIGIRYNDQIKGYPVPILDWHEIVNDGFENHPFAITYCPLTGTGIGWSRDIGQFTTTYGVSGLLYNTNLMPYDRRTRSIWSQLETSCVNGTRIGEQPKTYTLIETTLATWKKAFPNSLIMNADTGFDRAYAVYPYGKYRSDHDLLFFPVNRQDNRVPNKERLLGVVEGKSVKVYPFNGQGDGAELIYDEFGGMSLIILRSADDNFNTAFIRQEGRYYSILKKQLPAIMQDDQGNQYDLSGFALSGPQAGKRLEQPHSFIGYWFSFPAFYDEILLFE